VNLGPRHLFSNAQIAGTLRRARATTLQIAALIASWLGADILAQDIRCQLAAELRWHARAVRAAIVLKAFAGLRLRPRSVHTRHPLSAPAGCRMRLGHDASKRRLVTHIVSARTGLTSRDPHRLIAAIDHAVKNAARIAARLAKRVSRGFKPNAFVMTRPPAISFATAAPKPHADAPDSS